MELPHFDPNVMTRYTAVPDSLTSVSDLVRKGDPSYRKVKYRPLIKTEIFNLEDEEERSEYTRVMQGVADGLLHLIHSPTPSVVDGKYRVVLIWAEPVVMSSDTLS